MDIRPRVLIFGSSDDWTDSLSRGLDALGWPTLTATSPEAAEAAVQDFGFDAAILHGTFPAGLAARLKSGADPRRLPVIAVEAASDDADGADVVFPSLPHISQIALRIEQMLRAAVTEEEFALRRRTLADHGVALDAAAIDHAPFRVLIAGAADARFLGLSNALADRGLEAVAAPTPYTAFDYLHEAAFDAAVLWGTSDKGPALSIASGMKRNTRLYHIPLILALKDAGDVDLAELFHRGFAEIFPADAEPVEMASRIAELARLHRHHLSLRRAMESARSSPVMDVATGLFTPGLFAAHLARLAGAGRARRRPLSVALLRVARDPALDRPRREGWLDRAMPQIGAMVARLVRVEDTAARLSGEVFALALPATPGPAARLAAERIAAVIGCTAFDAGSDRSPFVVSFDIAADEIGPDEHVGAVLDRLSKTLGRAGPGMTEPSAPPASDTLPAD